MADLTESSTWEPGIYQLEVNDPVDAGVGGNGVSNRQAKELANRTVYLKDHVDALEANDPVQDAAITAIEATGIVTYGGRKFKNKLVVSANTTLTATEFGQLIEIDTAGVIVTMPLSSYPDSGMVFGVFNSSGGTAVLSSGAWSFIPNIGPITLEPGDFVEVAFASTGYLITSIQQVSSFVPEGTVTAFAANTPPAGYLACNGAAISQTTYAKLYTRIGLMFGAGGAGTFRVPDLRGEFIRGWDNGRGIDTGRVFATAQADELKSHDHTYKGATIVPTGSDPTGTGSTFTVGATGSTGGGETRPRNIALLYCIKY